jgi:hypothetical protein
LHITQARDLLFQNLLPSMFWGSTNFVDFVQKKEETLQLIVLDKTKTKNPLGNGGSHCMPFKPEMN